MNSEQQTVQATTPNSSPPTFDDLPLLALLEKDPSQMSQEELVAFVTHLRGLRQVQVLKAKIARELDEEESGEVKTPKLSAQQLIEDLLK